MNEIEQLRDKIRKGIKASNELRHTLRTSIKKSVEEMRSAKAKSKKLQQCLSMLDMITAPDEKEKQDIKAKPTSTVVGTIKPAEKDRSEKADPIPAKPTLTVNIPTGSAQNDLSKMMDLALQQLGFGSFASIASSADPDAIVVNSVEDVMDISGNLEAVIAYMQSHEITIPPGWLPMLRDRFAAQRRVMAVVRDHRLISVRAA